MKREIQLGKNSYTVTAHRRGEYYATVIEDNDSCSQVLETKLEHIAGNDYNVIVDGQATKVQLVVHGEKSFIRAFERNFELEVVDPVDAAAQKSGSSALVKAPMPGMIVEVNVESGQQVNEGDALLTIESMKIMMVIRAWRDGEIDAINFAEGDTFDKNAVLVSMIEELEEQA